jgi:hypothetical protein
MREEPLIISGAVEGVTDEVVLRSLIQAAGLSVGTVYGKQGKDHLKKNLAAYNQAARYTPWCVLLDLDQDADCAPLLCSALLPEPGGWMCLRIVVRSIEAWLMADREQLAAFLSIPVSRIPTDVEAVERPKETLINLAARSRRRAIKEDMVPREGSGRSVGPGYTAQIIEFVTDQERGWRPLVAAAHADSLRRCMDCLRRLGSGY